MLPHRGTRFSDSHFAKEIREHDSLEALLPKQDQPKPTQTNPPKDQTPKSPRENLPHAKHPHTAPQKTKPAPQPLN